MKLMLAMLLFGLVSALESASSQSQGKLFLVKDSPTKGGPTDDDIGVAAVQEDPNAPALVEKAPVQESAWELIDPSDTEDADEELYYDAMLQGFSKALLFLNKMRAEEGLLPVETFPVHAGGVEPAGKGPPVFAAWVKLTSGVAFKVCTKLTVDEEVQYVTLEYEGETGVMTAVTPSQVLGRKALVELIGAMANGETIDETPGEQAAYPCNTKVEQESVASGFVDGQFLHPGGALSPWGKKHASLIHQYVEHQTHHEQPIVASRCEADTSQGFGLLEERRTTYHAASQRANRTHNGRYRTFPQEFNSREEYPDCALGVKDQGACGSCYAFAVSASAGERLCIRGVKAGGPAERVELSQQDMISCGNSGSVENRPPFCTGNGKFSAGCKGAEQFASLYYVHKHGLPTLECSPYSSGGSEAFNRGTAQTENVEGFDANGEKTPLCSETKSDKCHMKQAQNRLGPPVFCPSGDVACIKDALMDGPVTATIYAYAKFHGQCGLTPEDEKYPRGCTDGVYGDGRWNGRCGHLTMVQLFGWGVSESGIDYWWGRNSWGTSWGLDGLFKIRLGRNEYGIESKVAFNPLDVEDRSVYNGECVHVEDTPEGVRAVNTCDDVRSVAIDVESPRSDGPGGFSDGACAPPGTYMANLNPGTPKVFKNALLGVVTKDVHFGPYDSTTHYKDVTTWLHQYGYAWITCALENHHPGPTQLCKCCGSSCVCLPNSRRIYSVDENLCNADVCGGPIEEVERWW